MTSLFIPGPCTELRKEKLCNLYIYNKRANILKNSYNVKCNYKCLKINLKDEDLVIFFYTAFNIVDEWREHPQVN